MKLSKKFKMKMKKNITIALANITLVTMSLAIIKLADVSMFFSEKINEIDKESQTKTASVTKLQNTDTITYIYDAADFVAFRDSVNAGNNLWRKNCIFDG